MKRIGKLLVGALALAAVAAAVAAVFFALSGSYWFRSEPVRHKPSFNLEKKSLSSRQPLTEELSRDALSGAGEREAYDALKESAYASQSEPFWLHSADADDLLKAFVAFQADHPDVFWIDDEDTYQYYEEDEGLCVELIFTEEGEALAQDQQELSAAVEEAAKGAPDNADDYEIELYLNDYLTDHCVYDSDSGSRHTAYGALAQGRAVCDGYSRAFQLLCRRLGVSCTVVEGSSEFNTDTADGHAWNCVRLGDSWYHVDATWNDSTDAACGIEHYFYLNLTDEMIARDHTVSGDFEHRSADSGNSFNVFLPVCDSDELNYFRLNIVNITSLDDDDEILAAMLEAARAQQSYCAFTVDESLDFNAVREAILNGKASAWIRGVNHFSGDSPKLSQDAQVISYEEKRVLAIQYQYE